MPKKTTRKTNQKTEVEDVIAVEQASEEQAEAEVNPEGAPSDQVEDEQAAKASIVERGAGEDQEIPAEIAAIHEVVLPKPKSKLDRKKAKKAERQETRSTKVEASAKAKQAGHRSAKYLKAKSELEPGKTYQLKEALELVKKVSLSKFDGAVEIHLKLMKKKAKANTESARGIFHLPHGTGKEKNIVILDEAKIEYVAKTNKIDFDIALATPEMMPKVAKIARILGPKGKMPDPKTGTVTTDPKKTIEEIKAGKVEYRVDSQDNIHQTIGRVSWDTSKLLENAQAVLSGFPKSRLASVTLAASISPSVPIDLASLK